MKTCLHRSHRDRTKDRRGGTWGSIWLFGTAVLACLTLSGCMGVIGSPSGVLVDETKPVWFFGFQVQPGQKVTIEAKDPMVTDLQAGWATIGTTTAINYPMFAGVYPWVTSLPIPNKYWAKPKDCATYDEQVNKQQPAPCVHPWTCATVGDTSLVRAKTGQYSTIVNYAGYAPVIDLRSAHDCYNAHPRTDPVTSYNPFLYYCQTSDSPIAVYHSLDYRDFGKECVQKINELRKLDGKPPLQEYKEGECDADSDAKCDYDWVQSHPTDPHHCSAGGALQNGCGVAPDVDHILGYCLESMYNEKSCYVSTNGKCTTCECAHYYFMVQYPEVDRVSCGIYQTPDGGFKSVQNYYRRRYY